MQNAHLVFIYMFIFFARHKNAKLLKILPGKRIGELYIAIYNIVAYFTYLYCT